MLSSVQPLDWLLMDDLPPSNPRAEIHMADPGLLDGYDPTSVELIVDAVDDLKRRFEPVTCGIPWPRGVLRECSVLVMADEAGLEVPLQAKALDRWADGSVRWALLDWRASVNSRAVYGGLDRPEAALEVEGPRVDVVSRSGTFVEVSTGRETFRLSVGGVGLFDSVEVDGVMAIDAARTRLTAEDGAGTILEVRSRGSKS